MRGRLLLIVLAAAFLGNMITLAALPRLWAQPHLCTDEVFPPLAAGYAALRAGEDEKAKAEFEKVLSIDGFNPYALNNLAVLAERQGKLKEAMAYLLTAETYAASYCHKLEEICEVDGLCLAVLPSPDKGSGSSVAAIIHSNIHLLKQKISRTGKPAP